MTNDSLGGDLKSAQRRNRTLADLAAKHLDSKQLNGFSFTIAAYLVALSGNSAVYDDIVAELESEKQAEFSPGDKP